MAATTTERDAKRRGENDRLRQLGVAASTTILRGVMSTLNASGYAVEATAAQGLPAEGIARTTADNSAGVAGAVKVVLEVGVFKMKNAAGGDALVQADVGKPCFIYDNQTVGKGGSSAGGVAGIVEEVVADGVFVYFGGDGLQHQDGRVEDVTAPGALDPHIGLTRLAVDGTDAFTMADGTRIGQRKRILCVAAANTPVGTLTPSNLQGFSTILFNAVGESVDLEWNGTAWQPVLVAGATLA